MISVSLISLPREAMQRISDEQHASPQGERSERRLVLGGLILLGLAITTLLVLVV